MPFVPETTIKAQCVTCLSVYDARPSTWFKICPSCVGQIQAMEREGLRIKRGEPPPLPPDDPDDFVGNLR